MPRVGERGELRRRQHHRQLRRRRTSTAPVIEADVHVGSNCVLVAPVTIGAGGTVGGGSTITKSTEPGASSVARGKQVSIANWHAPRQTTQALICQGACHACVHPVPTTLEAALALIAQQRA